MPVASPSAETLVLVLKKRKEPHFSFSVSFPCLLVEKSILSLPDQFENSVSWNLKIGGEPHHKELGERRVTRKSSVCCMLAACLEGLASEKLPKHKCMRGEGAGETPWRSLRMCQESHAFLFFRRSSSVLTSVLSSATNTSNTMLCKPGALAAVRDLLIRLRI